jgi:folate-binding protein YgfZ
VSARADVRALERGQAFVNLSSWWKVGVEGADAGGWLNDLLSAELSGMSSGEARSSLLLTPTGRIRAAVTVTRFEDGYLLLQDPAQPSRIDGLLDPYVLSSDVLLRDRTQELGLIAFPNLEGPSIEGAATYAPSILGRGTDVVTAPGNAPSDLAEADLDAVETWRVRRGVARFAVDLGTDSLPHEIEVGELIAYDKGCFLGQEAVARVRNLGHPPFVLLAADAPAAVAAGDTVMAEDREAGTVTSAAGDGSSTAVIARVRWALKDSSLRTASGVELLSRGPASAA